MTFTTQKPLNKVVWELSHNEDKNKNYLSSKKNLESLIKSCHQLLYNECSIVGSKAQDDIMKILTIKILEKQFSNEKSKLYKKCLSVKKEQNMKDGKYNELLSYCQNLENLRNEDNIIDKWAKLIKTFLTKVLGSIYTHDDSVFNIPKDDEATLFKLIDLIMNFKIDKNFEDTYSSTCGDVHESFRNYSGGKGAKDLGQFFTPRNLIHALFYGVKFNDEFKKINDAKIYDPCMGTGGFLTRLYQLGNVKAKNIYGCETELSTIKFAETSIALTTKKFSDNLYHCNSLCENPLLFKGSMDCIVTNPPFGTRMKYDELKKKFNDYKESNFEESELNFKDIYPLKMNNGACLFVQHCVHMLRDGGLCVIVLPYGEIFNGSSKWSVSFRKWLLTNVNITQIIYHQGGTFEHAGVATATIIFKKGEQTKKVQFYETSKDCKKITEIFTVAIKDIEKNNLVLSHTDYETNKDDIKYKVEIKELEEVCEFKNGKNITKKDLIKGAYPVIGGGKKPMGYHNKYNCDENTIVCSSSGAYAGYINKYSNKIWASDCMSITPNNTKILNENYLWNYLKSIQYKIYNLQSGSGQPHVYSRDLKKLKIPVPPLEIQETIIKEIEKIEPIIENLKNINKSLKDNIELVKSTTRIDEIDNLLEDVEMKELGEMCELKTGKFNSKDCKEKGKYPFYTSHANNPKGFSDSFCFDYDKYLILIKDGGAGAGNYGNNIGLGKVFKVSGKASATTHQLALYNVNKNINFNYFSYFLIFSKNKIMDLAKYTTGLGCIKKSSIEKLKIPVPSFEKQKELIKIYEDIENTENFMNKQIENNEKLIEVYQNTIQGIIYKYCN
tara:strand:+ start:8780 stop:11293 length:2514 start_codon:yes stop_codon:yes gene_type:complete